MEFWQFHPTGVAGAGVLITEGVRGEGGILLNCNGERFMERYAPEPEGPRFARRRQPVDGPGDQGRPRLRAAQGLRAAEARPPRPRGDPEAACRRSARSRSSSPTSTASRSRSRSCRRSTTRWAASRPTFTARWSRRSSGDHKAVVNGLYAVGECACVSVHGANRLGTNSLLDLHRVRPRGGQLHRRAEPAARVAQAAAGRRGGRPARAARAARRRDVRRIRLPKWRATCARRCRRTAACSAIRSC